MYLLKKIFALLLAIVLCLSLTACTNSSNEDPDSSIVGNDWRVTGVVRDGGTITRDGEDTYVLVCIHKNDATLYYDSEDQTLFGYVEYPITLGDNVWDMFKGIDFADVNGDGNSDVTMKFDNDGNELLMVWFWDSENSQFVYQPEESKLGEYDDGRDDAYAVPVLMGGALPFTNMKNLKSENYEDGTYYYADATEDGKTIVVNTVQMRNLVDDTQTLEDYLTGCALSLREADTYHLQTIEENDVYTKMMSYPVYIVTYTSGENEDACEWTVFAMDKDRYTYLYGFCTTLDALDDEIKNVYQGIFAGLYLSDEE